MTDFASSRRLFHLPQGLLYLDGNSLGPLPLSAETRAREVLTREWGDQLIRAWNSADWIGLPRRVGDRIGRLIGAPEGSVATGDTLSVKVFQALAAALALNPERKVVLSDTGNFPSDLYIASGLLQALGSGLELRLVEPEAVESAIDDSVAVTLITEVDYRTGRRHDMKALTAKAHAVGAVTVWDLAHSAGAVPVDLTAADADFAVGCSYKYLNGGPGAPAFVWAHPRHTARMDREGLRQPLSGWLGHAAPFEFAPSYRPAPGIARFTCGTPPILAMRALECGLEVFGEAEALGGMPALRDKAIALTSLFIERVEASCAGLGLTLASPRAPAERGSQASFAHADGYPVMQALIERGVVGDFRAGQEGGDGHLLRFGFTPLYTRFVDAWDAAVVLAEVLADESWREPRFSQRAAVT